MAKATTTDKNEKEQAVKPAVSLPAGQAKATDQKPAQPVRRAPGVKEVIPFEWKLIGDASGLALTLFKSVEREDTDAQLIRLSREGYYKNLRILGNDAAVAQRAALAARIPVHKVPSAAKKKAPKPKKLSAAAKKRQSVIVAKLKPKPVPEPAKSKAKAKGKKVAKAKSVATKKTAAAKTKKKKKTAKKK